MSTRDELIAGSEQPLVDRDWLFQQAEADYTEYDGAPVGWDRMYELAVQEGWTRNKTIPGAVGRAAEASSLSLSGTTDALDPILRNDQRFPQAEHYLEELEALYDEHGENIPLNFFLQYEPEDLKYFHKVGGIDFGPGLAEVFEQQARVAEARKAKQDAIDETYNSLLKEEQGRRNFWTNTMRFVGSFAGGVGVAAQVIGDVEELSADEHNKLMDEATAIVEGRGQEWHANEIVDKMIKVGDFTFSEDDGGSNFLEDGNDGLFRRTNKGDFIRDWAWGNWKGLLDTANATWNPYQDDREVTDQVRAAMVLEVQRRLQNGQTETEIRHGDNWTFRFFDDAWNGTKVDENGRPENGGAWLLGHAMKGITDGLAQNLDQVTATAMASFDIVSQNNWKGDDIEKWDEYYEKWTLGGLYEAYVEEHPDTILYDGGAVDNLEKALDEWDETVALGTVQVAHINEAQNQWQQHAADQDDVYEAFMTMGGFDPKMAFDLFAGEVMPDAEEQLEYVGQSYDQMEDMLNGLRDSETGDFSSGSFLLNALAAYGKAVPMTIATGLTAMAADDEWRNDLLYNSNGIWGDDSSMIGGFRAKAKNENYSPAQMLGYDGTLSGVILDLTAGAVADPITWMTGGSAKAGAITSVKTAERLATKGVGKVWADDAARIAVESTDQLLFHRQTAWMGKYGDEALLLSLGKATQEEISNALQQGAKQAMLNGHKNPLAQQSALAVRAGATMRRIFNSPMDIGDLERRVARIKTPQTTNRRIHTSSPDFYTESTGFVETVVGTDPLLRDQYLRRIMDLRIREAKLAREASGAETATRLQLDLIDDAIERIGVWADDMPINLDEFDESLRPILDDPQPLPQSPQDEAAQFRADENAAIDDAMLERRAQQDLEMRTFEEGQAPAPEVAPEPKRWLKADLSEGERLASTNRQTGRIALDEDAIRADWDEGLPYLKGEKGPNSAEKAQILDELGVDPAELQARLGDADTYIEFIHRHERWHVDNPEATGYAAEKAATEHALNWLDEGAPRATRGVDALDDTLGPVAGDVPAAPSGLGATADEQRAAALAEGQASMEAQARTSTTFGRDGDGVNVGRETSGGEVGPRSGKSFGNPYRVGADGTVEEVVERYAQWLDEQIAADPQFADDVAELSGKTLRCPTRSPHSPCHAEVLAQKADELAAAKNAGPVVDRDAIAMEANRQRIARLQEEGALARPEARRLAEEAADRKVQLINRLEREKEALIFRRDNPNDPNLIAKASFDRGAEMQSIMDDLVVDFFYKEELWKKVKNLVHKDDIPRIEKWVKEAKEAYAAGKALPDKPPVHIFWEELSWGQHLKAAERDAARLAAMKKGKQEAPPKQWLPDDPALYSDDLEAGQVMASQANVQFGTYSGLANHVTAVEMKASPYLLYAATSGNRNVLNAASKSLAVDWARKQMDRLMQLWMIDKLIGPRTAMVVSFDEMMRIYSRYGIGRTIQHQLQGAYGRTSKYLRAGKMGNTAEERALMRALDDAVPEAARLERALSESATPNWQLLDRKTTKTPEFEDAARRMIAGNMNDSGFRAYVRGREAFDEWWATSPDAQTMRVRGATKFDEKGVPHKHVPSADEIWNMYDNVFPALFNGKHTLKNGQHIKDALKHIADEVERGGKVGVSDDLLQSVDKVMGVPPNRRMGDAFFNKMFANPLQRRRSLIYRLEAELEESRLAKLFKDQGRVILPDHEIARRLNMQLDDAVGFREAMLDHILETTNYVPEGHISRLVDRAANDAMDRMLYGWDQMTSLQEGAKHFAPFAGPWADMWSFWFKEVFSRPYIRGTYGKDNWFLNTITGGVNPKPFAMASRLAATDFELDNINDGPTVMGFGLFSTFGKSMEALGINSLNPSSLIFLPTAGNNPAGTMIPQPGPMPMWIIDLVVGSTDDPTEWRQRLSEFSEFFPGAGFSRGNASVDFVNRWAGGGLVSRGSSILTNAAIAIDPEDSGARDAREGVSRWVNDWSAQSLSSQELRSQLATGEVNLEKLMELSGDRLDAQINALVINADRKAALTDMAGNDLFSYLAPTSVDTGVVTEEVEDIWIQAGMALPGTFGQLSPNATRAQKREYAERVRNSYFKDLSEEERLIALVASPNMAINLVSGWEWTDAGQAALGVEALSPYRTGPTNMDRNRHIKYLNDGYIRHIDGAEYVTKVLDIVAYAKEKLATKLFEDTYKNLNEYKWNTGVSDDTKERLAGALRDERVIYSKLGINDEEELWRFFGSFADENERYVRLKLEDMGASEEEAEAIYSQWNSETNPYKIPTKERAFATSVPTYLGSDTTRVTDPFGGGELDITYRLPNGFRAMPDWAEQAFDVMGETYRRGFTTVDLYDVIKGVQDEGIGLKTDAAIAASAVSGAKWLPASEAAGKLVGIRDNLSIDIGTRELVNEFVGKDTLWSKRYENGIEMSNAEREDMRELYNRLKRQAPGVTDWDLIWETAYARQYGDLDFELPTAPKLTLDDGSRNPNAFVPSKVLYVTDGDTLQIRNDGALWNARVPLGNVKVRLIGADAAEMNTEEGVQMRKDLVEALTAARRRGDRVTLVTDPDYTGYEADHYGRILAWLYIGDTPYTTGVDGFIPRTGEN